MVTTFETSPTLKRKRRSDLPNLKSPRTFSVPPNLLSHCCQRYVFRQGSDNRQVNNLRREQSHFQISISRSSSNPINSAEILKRPFPSTRERSFHKNKFKYSSVSLNFKIVFLPVTSRQTAPELPRTVLQGNDGCFRSPAKHLRTVSRSWSRQRNNGLSDQ